MLDVIYLANHTIYPRVEKKVGQVMHAPVNQRFWFVYA